ncbi:MAG: hypothetical protein MO846_00810 [Candidatus Devosia symbiotica]|nr:hypothetical protein [Candidatus Devosia symbiotica]
MFWWAGLMDGAHIVSWLTDLGQPKTIEDLKIPFAAVAIDISFGSKIWLQSGSLVRSVRALIGMLGLFSPTKINERWLELSRLI